MKKVILITSILLLMGCSHTAHHNKGLEEAINAIVEDKNNRIIDLDTLITFTWEKGYLFTPYSTQEIISEQLGIDGFKDPSDLDWRDDIYLLVFVNDEQAVQYVEIARQGADFSIEENTYLTPANAKIRINRYEK